MASSSSSSSGSNKLTMKLLIDTKKNKVLFGEASKEVVDFLFNLLCLPISTVIRLLNKNGMVGSLANLYLSVDSLSETYMQPNISKDVLLKPKAPISSSAKISSFLLPKHDAVNTNSSKTSLFLCSRRNNTACHSYVTRVCNTRCPSCGNSMANSASFVGNEVAQDSIPIESGFVKEVVTYMVMDDLVMDDLVIQPMSTISSITLLNKFNVKEVGTLQEKVVELGMTQGVNLLKASLQSKYVLTTVFLSN